MTQRAVSMDTGSWRSMSHGQGGGVRLGWQYSERAKVGCGVGILSVCASLRWPRGLGFNTREKLTARYWMKIVWQIHIYQTLAKSLGFVCVYLYTGILLVLYILPQIVMDSSFMKKVIYLFPTRYHLARIWMGSSFDCGPIAQLKMW